MEFRTDVFDTASIKVLIERFERVLEAMTTDPTRSGVLDRCARRGQEYARLDEVGNRVVLSAGAPSAVSIPEVFAAQVARTPGAVALSLCGRTR